MHGNAGEQQFEDKRFYGDHGDGAMFLGRMQIGTFDIVPDDTKFLTFSYVIANLGHASDDLPTASSFR
jgi:hypothetical protein